ncbi:MAG: sulfurtransferase [Piscirickettsiaceae bacterium]|nr:MAG: sulfurtransferase [Piscirickettsiaceae bacterium]PCI69470.1 MAG: sulfurtransferase [Piscirickettsiaceae bacterium]
MLFFFRNNVYICTLLAAVSFLAGCAANQQKPTKQELYHGLPYHAVTTLTPPQGVIKVSATDLNTILLGESKPILIDVYGAIFREESLDFDGAWLVSTPRKNIIGSVWLPNVGKQELKPVVKLYFETNLKDLTLGDKSKTLVFYCIEDCWMAWNAAKRAHEWGYSDVLWFREGVDGWKDIKGQLEASEPINLPVND